MSGACRSEFNNDREYDEDDQYIGDESQEDEEEYENGRGRNSRIESKRTNESESESESDDDDDDENEESQKKIKSRPVPESKVNWSATHITFKIAGSLSDFAKKPKKCCNFISKNAKGIFESTKQQQQQQQISSKSDDTRTKNHMCIGISLTKVESDFPCSLALNVDGINIPNENKTFTSNGNSGSFIITPNMKHDSQEGIPLNQKSRDIDSPFIKNFPGWNLGNIHEGITHMNTKMSLIAENHPVVVMFNSVRMKRSEEPLNEENQPIKGFYNANRKDTEICLQKIKDKMQEHLKIQDLYNMGVSISRAFTENPTPINGINEDKKIGTWLDATEIFEGISGPNSQRRIIDEKHNLYVTFKVEYMNV